MMLTQLTGFQNAVQDAQSTFRSLMAAIAEPGRAQAIAVEMSPPQGISSACAAACLTLFDLETYVWLQPGLDVGVRAWLKFHSGCRFAVHSHQANFAVIGDVKTLPKLSEFDCGTADFPEHSTSLLIQVEDFTQGQPVRLTGPGILTDRSIAPQVPRSFWQQWRLNQQAYPLGIDVFLFTQTEVIGLPRTVKAEVLVSDRLES